MDVWIIQQIKLPFITPKEQKLHNFNKLSVTYLKGAIQRKVTVRKVMLIQNITSVACSCDLSTISDIL